MSIRRNGFRQNGHSVKWTFGETAFGEMSPN
jgi:hypothetical protein